MTAAPPATRLKFSIVVPTYNEAGGIEKLVTTLRDVFVKNDLDGEIVVVDDNSPDGTGAIVDRLEKEGYPVRCLHRPGKMGLSSGVIDGWKFARPDSQALGAMDADFSHDATILPRMVRALADGGYGLAVGSRYVPGGGIENWPKRRIITSRVAIALAQPLVPIKDITSGYFLVKREALDGVELDPIGFKIGLEVMAKAHYGRALEVPYVFTDRVAGESKLNQGEIFNYLKQLGRIYGARLRVNASGFAFREPVAFGLRPIRASSPRGLLDAHAGVAAHAARDPDRGRSGGAVDEVPQVRRDDLPPRSRGERLGVPDVQPSLPHARVRPHLAAGRLRLHRDRRRTDAGRPARLG